MKNYIKLGVLTVVLTSMLAFVPLSVVYAAPPSPTTSILPEAEGGADCAGAFNPNKNDLETKLKDNAKPNDVNNILGCAIKTGNIKLYMVPYFLRSILEFVIGISGIACVGAIVYGGFWYLFAGVSQDKEKGKKAIQFGLIGMILTLVAWALVNIVISLLTI